jgi:hypothetical protein
MPLPFLYVENDRIANNAAPEKYTGFERVKGCVTI